MRILRQLAMVGALVAGLGAGAAEALPLVKPTQADGVAAAPLAGSLVEKTTYDYPSWYYGTKWGGRRYDWYGHGWHHWYGHYPRSYGWHYYPRWRHSGWYHRGYW